jgi:shikimate dehydrogenase
LVERFSGLGARRAWVLGAGGAARAAVVALKAAGVDSVAVVARDPESAAQLHALGAVSLPWSRAALAEVAAGVGIVVQATSAGMRGADPGEELARLVPWSRIDSGAFAYDVVYVPAETPFLRVARAAGLSAEGGLSMLVAQAALAVELWLGRRPDEQPLLAAAAEDLGGEK